MKSVCVLMSTYNGEKYLKEQVDSILNQKNVNVSLLIRDDGSVDKTLDIISDYERKDSRVKLYRGDNVGACKSFLDLLWTVEMDYDYYALSDQDDVWLDNKLSTAVEAIGQNNGKLKLYCSKVIVTDCDLKPIESSNTIKYKCSFGNSLIENVVTGCTVVMESSFLKMLRSFTRPQKQYIHDWWLYKMATCYGTLIYDTNAYMYYRQHGNNTIGLADGLKGRILRLKNNANKIKNYVKEQNLEFEEIYNLPSEQKKLVTIVNHDKWNLITNKQIVRSSIIENIAYKIWMMFW